MVIGDDVDTAWYCCIEALFVRARCLSFSFTLAIALRLTGLSGSGACESAGRSSPLARLSKPIEEWEELDLFIPYILCSNESLLLYCDDDDCCGGGGGAAACQAAVRSVEAEYAISTFTEVVVEREEGSERQRRRLYLQRRRIPRIASEKCLD
jgi:hypothetical protein